MSKIIYLYDSQWNQLTQIYDANDFECTKKLSAYDTASFVIPATHPDSTSATLQAFNEVKVTEMIDGAEQTYIHWVISWVEADLDRTRVFIRSFEWLFEKKVNDEDKSYSSQTIDAIVQDLLDDLNTRYDTGITLDCWVTDTVDLDLSKGVTFSSALQEVVKLWYEYKVIDKVLCVKEIVWEDKTSGANYIELKWDIDEPNDRNLKWARVLTDWDQIVNAPYEAVSGFTTDATSISTYGRIERTVVADWSASVAKADALEKWKDLIKQIEVDPSIDDFFFANIWDLVQVMLDAGNDIMQFDGSAKILQIQIDTRGVVRVTVSSNSVRTPTLAEVIREHSKRLDKLEL